MAKRKSINKRKSRYSHRSSAGSGFLDPNSEILEEEEPFWWNNLTNNVNSQLAKYNAANETSKYLDSDSQIQSTSTNHEWWKMLETSDSEDLNNLPKQSETVSLKYKKIITSDTDENENDLPLQKRKIKMRNKSKRSKSNAFLKALNDSRNSESSESEQKDSITKPTNNASTSKKSLQELDSTQKHMNRKSNDSITTSIDQSHTTDKILKSKPYAFRKRYKEKSENAFENLLKSNEDLHNKTEKTEMISKSSFDKLIEKDHTSKENVLDISTKENKSEISSSETVLKNSIINPETSKRDNDLIYLNRTDSSFSLSNSNNENDYLKIQLNPMHETSHKNVSTNVSINQKESSVVEKDTNLSIDASTSKKINDSTANNEKIENHETTNKRETSLANIRYTSNKSEMENSNSNVRKTMYASKHESMNERNLTTEINDKNNTFQTLSTNIASKSLMNLSNSKSEKTNIMENKRTSFKISSEPDNIKSSMYSKSFTDYNSINNEPTEVGVFSGNQIHTINSGNNSVHTVNVITDASKNTTLKTKMSTSIHDIPELNEENVLTNKDKIQTEDSSMKALSLNKNSLTTKDIVTDNKNDNEHHVDQRNHEISDSINTGHQKKINEYFTVINSKLVSPTKAKGSKHFLPLSNTKEDEEIMARLNKKQKTIISKAVNVHLTKTKDSQLKKKQIIKNIEKLRMGNTQKFSAKDKVDKAYIVNGKVYKRPKLPRPKYWVTDRLYRFLWKIMEPKCKLLTRLHSEKFVQELSDIVSIITKSKRYENYETILNNLMKKMANLGIIRTRNDFYNFCYDFLPYDFRVKVVPMILPGNIRNIPYDPKTLNDSLLEE
ncbi:putative serine/threonine-protein kinase [Vespula squamosa]|uniref:Serine/threonine-protein kinase n=1 Tax=Vespula squamosa TaxID=30214 RepID=A0ABD2A8U5_VESSQ